METQPQPNQPAPAATQEPQSQPPPTTLPKVVRCKVQCQSVTARRLAGQDDEVHEAELVAVISGSEENAAFFAATPNAVFKLQVMREGHFVAGQHYYVDFTPAQA